VYTEHFGFLEHPFRITPDPRFFYPNPGHQEAYASLVYGLAQRRGFVVLTGEVGTGKTTLLRRLMQEFADSAHFAFIYNTTWSFDEVLDAICQDFEIPVRGAARQFDKVQSVNTFLLDQFKHGKTVALLIDEAHNLGIDVIEQLRLLSNLETANEKLLQIILVGQTELEDKLLQSPLRPLRDRVAIWGRLDRLKEQDVGPFILHRLRTAGCQQREIFLPEAVKRVALYSQGSPRRINIICDNALLTAYGAYQEQVSAEIIEEVARDLGFAGHADTLRRKTDVAAVVETSAPQAMPSPAEETSKPQVDIFPTGLYETDVGQESSNGMARLDAGWSRYVNGARATILMLFLLCGAGISLLYLSGRNPELIGDVTTKLSDFFREWVSSPGQQVEAKLVERVPVSETSEGAPKHGAKETADSKLIPQIVAPASAEQASAPQSIKTQEGDEDDVLGATASPVLAGAREQTPKESQERMSEQKLQTQLPKSSGVLGQQGQLVIIPVGATLFDLVSQTYGAAKFLALGLVKDYNPQLENFDRIVAGEPLWMPALTRETLLRKQPDGSFSLISDSFSKHREAKQWARFLQSKGATATISPLKISESVLLYRVMIEGLWDEDAVSRAWTFAQRRDGPHQTRIVEAEKVVTNVTPVH
jgi:type II secretory pathway predicted ATPase ExeA